MNMIVLIAGDLITLGLVTLVGFATHGTLGSAGLRLLTTFLPLLAGWAAAAPLLGLYNAERVVQPRQLWRVPWALLLAAPLAAWLRGAWLNAPILPVFVLVIMGTNSLGMFAWRSLYLVLPVAKR